MQFRAARRWTLGRKWKVSIPVWCNSEKIDASKATKLSTFQFQCGAIQSIILCHSVNLWIVFQFQCGAIQSVSVKLPPGTSNSFNSSVVQFRVSSDRRAIEHRWFQFQCGAIQRPFSIWGRAISSQFQFQCGAIQSDALHRWIKYLLGFNSSVVQFRGKAPLWFSTTIFQFQFQCGAIQSINELRAMNNLPRFNSSVVQFRVLTRPHHSRRKFVSIPVWCNSETHCQILTKGFSKFQFQCGAIQSWVPALSPLFIDCFNSSVVQFRDRKFSYHKDVLLSFNSSVVQFRALVLNALRCSTSQFQFQCGAIQSPIFIQYTGFSISILLNISIENPSIISSNRQ